ncbi:MAG TPA: TrkA C-terminal domain-containing protein [Actinocatenispora sp.]
MRVRVEKAVLPGIGVRHDLATSSGRRIGVITHRSGQRDLIVYDPDDPDESSDTVPLADDEADALAVILDASRVLSQLAGLHDQVSGALVIEQVPVRPGSPYVGRPLGDTQARTRTGASIVAVLRRGEALPSPGPDFTFAAGDLVVVVGTRDGVDGVADILAGRPRTEPATDGGAGHAPPGGGAG